MSRILRRPMFRGGGTVDSYGMGITAPLVPGYRMGGNIRGGIVDLPGGYDQTANERFIKSLSQDFGVPNAAISGGSTVNLPKLTLGSDLYPSGAVAPRSVNVAGVQDTGKSEVIEDIDFSEMNSDFDQTETVTVPDGKGGTKEIQAYKDQSEVEPSPIVKLNMPFSDYDREDYNRDMKKIETDKIQERLDAESDGVTGKGGGADMGGMTVSQIENLGDPDAGTGEGEETTQLSAKDAIAENQKLFAELLGSDKARGQDIGDMLLRFSGSGGNTLGEKFQNYVKAESAAGPSRSEKIKQTAAGLAINDYVASKRAKEQGELLTKKIDYELDAKERKLTPQAGDSNSDILRKISTAYKIEPTSNKAIKALLKFRTGRSDIFAITKDPTKIKPKDLEIGINIVTHKGAKTIIEKISETETKVLPFSGI